MRPSTQARVAPSGDMRRGEATKGRGRSYGSAVRGFGGGGRGAGRRARGGVGGEDLARGPDDHGEHEEGEKPGPDAPPSGLQPDLGHGQLLPGGSGSGNAPPLAPATSLKHG